MANIYESSFNVNSYYAVDATTGQQIAADSLGYIDLNVGDTVVFEDSHSHNHIFLNTIVFMASDSAMKVYLNDNEKYPIYVPANGQSGVQYMRVYSFTALSSGKLYYDGLAS